MLFYDIILKIVFIRHIHVLQSWTSMFYDLMFMLYFYLKNHQGTSWAKGSYCLLQKSIDGTIFLVNPVVARFAAHILHHLTSRKPQKRTRTCNGHALNRGIGIFNAQHPTHPIGSTKRQIGTDKTCSCRTDRNRQSSIGL
jgi:hypothetical protein